MVNLIESMPSYGKCAVAFDKWSAPWPENIGLVLRQSVPTGFKYSYAPGWQHLERRHAEYLASSIRRSNGVPVCHTRVERPRRIRNRKAVLVLLPRISACVGFVMGAGQRVSSTRDSLTCMKTCPCEPTSVGDPMQTPATGYLYEREVDYRGVPGSELRFERRYWGRKWKHSAIVSITYTRIPSSGTSYGRHHSA